MVRDRGDKATGDLLAWEPPVVAVGYAPDVAGKGDLPNKVARLMRAPSATPGKTAWRGPKLPAA